MAELVAYLSHPLEGGQTGGHGSARRLAAQAEAAQLAELLHLRFLAAGTHDAGGHAAGSGSNDSQLLLQQSTEEVGCAGPFLTGGCPEGSIQALSTHTLHQVSAKLAAQRLWCAC